jgi:hypothetical protein
MGLHGIVRRIRRPVNREQAAYYLELMLLSFAASVGGTRLLLELTGYPSLSSGELHIAHVLWGGLLLFAAAVLPVLLANRWVYTASALGAGVGAGLFMDEVGKFITQSNDYFYPAAAPIVYAYFLLTVLLYLEVRRPKPRDARTELYMALEGLEEVLDRDLNAAERAGLEARLHRVIHAAGDEDATRLARHLLDYLHSDAVRVAADSPGWFERLSRWWQAWEAQWWTRSRARAVLIGGLVGLALLGLWESLPAWGALGRPEWVEAILSPLVRAGRIAGPRALLWYEARLVLEAVVALILLAGAAALLVRREPVGIALGFLGLMLSLTVVDLMVFYFEQFSTIVVAAVQFAVLIGLHRYRQRFLLHRRWVDAE